MFGVGQSGVGGVMVEVVVVVVVVIVGVGGGGGGGGQPNTATTICKNWSLVLRHD